MQSSHASVLTKIEARRITPAYLCVSTVHPTDNTDTHAMPGPIAITRASPPNQGNAEASSSSAVPGASGSSLGLGSSLSRSGNHGRLGTTPSGALGASFTGPGSATYREAMARSFGKDANE